MTVVDLADTWRGTVGRLRQKGEADLLLKLAHFILLRSVETYVLGSVC